MSAVGSSPASKPSAGSEVSVELLQQAYHECKRKGGFREYTKQVRPLGGQYTVKLKQIKSLFENATSWTNKSAGSGHLKYKNKITGYVIEFKAHTGGKKDNDFDANAAESILDTLQNHINLLGDYIFQFPKIKGESTKWKMEPNYAKSLIQYRALRADSKRWADLYKDPYIK